MLPHGAVSVVLERAEVVRGSGLLALPLGALGAFALHGVGDGLREEVVLVLSIVVSQGANDGLVHEVLPAALLGKVHGIGRVGEVERGVATHRVGGGVPSHQRVRPPLSDGAVVVEGDLPDLLGVEGGLVGTRAQLLDGDHAGAAVGHLLAAAVGGVQLRNFGRVLGKHGIQHDGAGFVDHGGILLGHLLHLDLHGGHIFRRVDFTGLDETLLDGDDGTVGAAETMGAARNGTHGWSDGKHCVYVYV
mmetsp:Transcript_1916/g.4722  ORF Transcript_1916/g.4722 Transcript_1916/m.4722 type:complete len:247 (+) Transcript_1916:362-1102(+)